MTTDQAYYFKQLYPLQDLVLRAIAEQETGFYLTGGTAVSRAYLQLGEIRYHPLLGRIDSPENILANKLTALIGREEPRDLADIWGLCTKLGLSIQAALEGATSKATGMYPPDLARRLCTATHKDWEQVRWIEPPDPAQFLAELNQLGEQLILV